VCFIRSLGELTLFPLLQGGEKAMNVQLSQDETYADITPVRTSASNVS
jgi:hypothetical protein